MPVDTAGGGVALQRKESDRRSLPRLGLERVLRGGCTQWGADRAGATDAEPPQQPSSRAGYPCPLLRPQNAHPLQAQVAHRCPGCEVAAGTGSGAGNLSRRPAQAHRERASGDKRRASRQEQLGLSLTGARSLGDGRRPCPGAACWAVATGGGSLSSRFASNPFKPTTGWRAVAPLALEGL